MKLSFGMIFSIILIIIFIAFAIYAITHFLGFQKQLTFTQFFEDFQSDVDKMWKSTKGSQAVEYHLGKGAEIVCFNNHEYENLEINKGEDRQFKTIQHIKVESSFCIEPKDGKIKLTLEKNYGEPLVTVKEYEE